MRADRESDAVRSTQTFRILLGLQNESESVKLLASNTHRYQADDNKGEAAPEYTLQHTENVAQEVLQVEPPLRDTIVSKPLGVDIVLLNAKTHDALGDPQLPCCCAHISSVRLKTFENHFTFNLPKDLFKFAFQEGAGGLGGLKCRWEMVSVNDRVVGE